MLALLKGLVATSTKKIKNSKYFQYIMVIDPIIFIVFMHLCFVFDYNSGVLWSIFNVRQSVSLRTL